MFYSLKRIEKAIEHGDEIVIHDNDIISYGSNRVCYLYKSNPTKLIKVARHPEDWESDHKQSFSEWYVSKNITSKGIECRVSLCEKWVRTNKGPGLVVNRIIDNKGHSLTLRKLLFSKEISVESALNMIENIIKNFSEIGIPASDFNIDNFIFEGDINNRKLIMVDGFSPKNLNLKTHLLLHSKVLSNYYTKRKWRKTKSRFTYCAEKVYAGNYRFAAATPLHDITPRYSNSSPR